MERLEASVSNLRKTVEEHTKYMDLQFTDIIRLLGKIPTIAIELAKETTPNPSRVTEEAVESIDILAMPEFVSGTKEMQEVEPNEDFQVCMVEAQQILCEEDTSKLQEEDSPNCFTNYGPPGNLFDKMLPRDGFIYSSIFLRGVDRLSLKGDGGGITGIKSLPYLMDSTSCLSVAMNPGMELGNVNIFAVMNDDHMNCQYYGDSSNEDDRWTLVPTEYIYRTDICFDPGIFLMTRDYGHHMSYNGIFRPLKLSFAVLSSRGIIKYHLITGYSMVLQLLGISWKKAMWLQFLSPRSLLMSMVFKTTKLIHSMLFLVKAQEEGINSPASKYLWINTVCEFQYYESCLNTENWNAFEVFIKQFDIQVVPYGVILCLETKDFKSVIGADEATQIFYIQWALQEVDVYQDFMPYPIKVKIDHAERLVMVVREASYLVVTISHYFKKISWFFNKDYCCDSVYLIIKMGNWVFSTQVLSWSKTNVFGIPSWQLGFLIVIFCHLDVFRSDAGLTGLEVIDLIYILTGCRVHIDITVCRINTKHGHEVCWSKCDAIRTILEANSVCQNLDVKLQCSQLLKNLFSIALYAFIGDFTCRLASNQVAFVNGAALLAIKFEGLVVRTCKNGGDRNRKVGSAGNNVGVLDSRSGLHDWTSDVTTQIISNVVLAIESGAGYALSPDDASPLAYCLYNAQGFLLQVMMGVFSRGTVNKLEAINIWNFRKVLSACLYQIKVSVYVTVSQKVTTNSNDSMLESLHSDKFSQTTRGSCEEKVEAFCENDYSNDDNNMQLVPMFFLLKYVLLAEDKVLKLCSFPTVFFCMYILEYTGDIIVDRRSVSRDAVAGLLLILQRLLSSQVQIIPSTPSCVYRSVLTGHTKLQLCIDLTFTWLEGGSSILQESLDVVHRVDSIQVGCCGRLVIFMVGSVEHDVFYLLKYARKCFESIHLLECVLLLLYTWLHLVLATQEVQKSGGVSYFNPSVTEGDGNAENPGSISGNAILYGSILLVPTWAFIPMCLYIAWYTNKTSQSRKWIYHLQGTDEFETLKLLYYEMQLYLLLILSIHYEILTLFLVLAYLINSANTVCMLFPHVLSSYQDIVLQWIEYKYLTGLLLVRQESNLQWISHARRFIDKSDTNGRTTDIVPSLAGILLRAFGNYMVVMNLKHSIEMRQLRLSIVMNPIDAFQFSVMLDAAHHQVTIKSINIAVVISGYIKSSQGMLKGSILVTISKSKTLLLVLSTFYIWCIAWGHLHLIDGPTLLEIQGGNASFEILRDNPSSARKVIYEDFTDDTSAIQFSSQIPKPIPHLQCSDEFETLKLLYFDMQLCLNIPWNLQDLWCFLWLVATRIFVSFLRLIAWSTEAGTFILTIVAGEGYMTYGCNSTIQEEVSLSWATYYSPTCYVDE